MSTLAPTPETLIAWWERNPDRDTDARWYHDARAEARKRARRVGLPLNTYLGVVAATSPLQQWRTKDGGWPNLDAADRVIAWHRGERPNPATLTTSANAARDILNGQDPATRLGPKTRSFYLNLATPDHSDAVTLDRWALRALGLGDQIAPSKYDATAEIYRQAARRLDVPVDALQAAVWSQIKREYQG